MRRFIPILLVLLFSGCTLLTTPAVKNRSAGSTYTQPPLLEWWPVSGTDRYDLQVATTPDFAHPVINVVDLRRTRFQLPARFADERRYYWRVRAVGGGPGSSPWSGTQSFRFALSAPQPSAVVEPARFRFAWRPIPRATGYQVQIATGRDFSAPLLDRRLTEPLLEMASSLERGVRYRWRVRAIRGQLASGWSTPQTLFVKIPPPVVVVPPAKQVVRQLRPEIHWKKAAGALRVQIELTLALNGRPAKEPLLRDLADATGGVYRPDYNLRAGTDYAYRLRLVFPGGPGPWSEPIRLTVAPAVPDRAVRLLDTGRWHETAPSLSPDGTRLAAQLTRKSKEATQLKRSAKESAAPKIRAVFVSKPAGLPIGQADQLDRLDKGAPPIADFQKPTRSKDGRLRVYAAELHGNWDIFVEDLQTKKRSQITTSFADDRHPIITDTEGGYTILFQSTRGDGGWGLYKVTLKKAKGPVKPEREEESG